MFCVDSVLVCWSYFASDPNHCSTDSQKLKDFFQSTVKFVLNGEDKWLKSKMNDGWSHIMKNKFRATFGKSLSFQLSSFGTDSKSFSPFHTQDKNSSWEPGWKASLGSSGSVTNLYLNSTHINRATDTGTLSPHTFRFDWEAKHFFNLNKWKSFSSF